MAWEYVKAVRKGRSVTIYLENIVDGESVDATQLIWTRDKDQPWTDFVAMVKTEVKALITFWNSTDVEEDVTKEFERTVP